MAASDSGRIVAARNVPGRIARFSWFKVWEPDGTSTVEGPLNAPSGWTVYVYPLGFDVTADGKHMVYGYSNSGFCCPIRFAQGTYVRPVTNSALEPIVVSGQQHPTLFGSRMIAHSGAMVNVQTTAATTYGTDFTPWIDVSGTGLELRRTDLAANGQLAALELEQWNGGSQTIGKIAVVSTQGVDQPPTFAVDCFVPASGVAKDVSLSADATRIAWTDGQGLKVAGAPASAGDPCALTSPPVVISPTASQGAIGGANVAPFLPVAPPAQPPTGRPAADRRHGAGGDPAEEGHDDGAGRRQGRADQGQGRPRRQGQDLRDRPGEDPAAQRQARRRRDRIGDREARRDRDGEGAADRRRAQEAQALEGRADDAAREPRRPHRHQARHASMTAARTRASRH